MKKIIENMSKIIVAVVFTLSIAMFATISSADDNSAMNPCEKPNPCAKANPCDMKKDQEEMKKENPCDMKHEEMKKENPCDMKKDQEEMKKENPCAKKNPCDK